MEPFVKEERQDGPGLYWLRGWVSRFPGLTAGFTGRNGGHSAEPFGTLNCGLHVGDAPDSVAANRRRVADTVGIPLENWTFGEQVHGSRVAVVTAAEAGRGTLQREDAIQDTDAFISRTPGVCIGALFADCVPLFFYDPAHRAVGLAHAGWKGTAAAIAVETVKAMEREFGTQPADLYAAVGPSIGACCYEVDETVVGQISGALSALGTELSGEGAHPFFTKKENGRYMLNLQQTNRQIMIKAGIMPSHIEITSWCTSCRNDIFFSHRKDRGKTGRMSAWIGLAPLSENERRESAF
jgi:YfiH family protein